jgi:hypothetical protein
MPAARDGFGRHSQKNTIDYRLTLIKRLHMKLKILLMTFLCLCAAFVLNAQINTPQNIFEISAFNRLVKFLSVDTQLVKISDFEKNNIPHLGEEHRLVPAVFVDAPGNYIIQNASWDRFLPSVYNKEATHGSPFLISLYVQGLVVNQFDSIIAKPDYLYNYDKVTGNLLLQRNNEKPIAVNKEQVNMFCLKLDRGGFIFMKVPAINANEFFQVILKGPKYSCFKLYKNIFVNANQKSSTGYTPDGENFDQYIDIVTYYIVNEKNNSFKVFELNKKSIKSAFVDHTDIITQFFKDHKHQDLTETFVAQLVDNLNSKVVSVACQEISNDFVMDTKSPH